jgi:predicted O-methyltransferase YrrM
MHPVETPSSEEPGAHAPPASSRMPRSSLRSAPVSRVLERLHASARKDAYRFLRLVPAFVLGTLRGLKFQEIVTVEAARTIYMPISREQGELLYLVARSIRARTLVEFGTSFGISTAYLAAAARDEGGRVVSTELEPGKHAAARANLAEAGLLASCDLRLGDAMETLREGPRDIDLVFLDGWKDLYLPVLKMLQPRLSVGAVVLADNIFTFEKALRPFVDHVRSGENGFVSATIPLGAGLEYAVYTGVASRDGETQSPPSSFGSSLSSSPA